MKVESQIRSNKLIQSKAITFFGTIKLQIYLQLALFSGSEVILSRLSV